MKLLIGTILVSLLSLTTGLADLNEPGSTVIDFPLGQNMAVPVWMNTPPEVTTDNSGEQFLRIPILPQSTDESLLLEAFFHEQSGTPIQVEWVDANGTVTLLSNDLSEGIGMANQRSVLISPATMGTGGTLVISGETLLSRIKLEWLAPSDSLASEGQPSLLVAPSGQEAVSSDQLSGESPSIPQNQWKGRVVETTFINTPERADTPVQYPLALEAIPDMARLKLKVNGLSFGQHLVVWLNQQRAGIIQPSVPDLSNPGYLDTNRFVGWREGSVLLPRALFKTGENDLQFSTEPDDNQQPAISQPLAIRDASIQFIFPESDNSDSSSSVPNNASDSTAAEPTSSSENTDHLSPGNATAQDAQALTNKSIVSNPNN